MAILAPVGNFPSPAPGDVQIVVKAARLLRIREFEIFRLAYQRWYGRRAADTDLEPVFANYLFREEAPCWVRHFTRSVIDASRQGRLDPTQFGLPPRARSEPRPLGTAGLVRYVVTVAWIMALMLALLKVV